MNQKKKGRNLKGSLRSSRILSQPTKMLKSQYPRKLPASHLKRHLSLKPTIGFRGRRPFHHKKKVKDLEKNKEDKGANDVARLPVEKLLAKDSPEKEVSSTIKQISVAVCQQKLQQEEESTFPSSASTNLVEAKATDPVLHEDFKKATLRSDKEGEVKREVQVESSASPKVTQEQVEGPNQHALPTAATDSDNNIPSESPASSTAGQPVMETLQSTADPNEKVVAEPTRTATSEGLDPTPPAKAENFADASPHDTELLTTDGPKTAPETETAAMLQSSAPGLQASIKSEESSDALPQETERNTNEDPIEDPAALHAPKEATTVAVSDSTPQSPPVKAEGVAGALGKSAEQITIEEPAAVQEAENTTTAESSSPTESPTSAEECVVVLPEEADQATIEGPARAQEAEKPALGGLVERTDIHTEVLTTSTDTLANTDTEDLKSDRESCDKENLGEEDRGAGRALKVQAERDSNDYVSLGEIGTPQFDFDVQSNSFDLRSIHEFPPEHVKDADTMLPTQDPSWDTAKVFFTEYKQEGSTPSKSDALNLFDTTDASALAANNTISFTADFESPSNVFANDNFSEVFEEKKELDYPPLQLESTPKHHGLGGTTESRVHCITSTPIVSRSSQ